MSQTKLEQIKEFNEKSALKTKQLEEENKDQLESDKTTKEKVKEKAEEKPKTAEEIAAETQRLKEEQEQLQRDQLHQLTEATSTIISRINEPVNNAKNFISALPTPGGIAAMLIALAVFALFVIPVNEQGKTRGQLFFQSLLGRTHMLYRENTTIGGSVIHGASGDFGTHGGPSINNNNVMYSEPSTPVIDISNLDLFGFNS